MTGFGQTGPMSQAAGHDLNYIALTGALHAIGPAGGKPVPPLNLIGDYGGGALYLAMGLLAALHERTQSGRGQVVDAAMVDGVSMLAQMMWTMKSTGVMKDQRESFLLDGGAPYYRVYETSDGGYMAVGSIEPQFFAQLLVGLGLDPAEVPNQFDLARYDEMRDIFAARFASRTRAEWTEKFAGTDACVTPVLSWTEAAAGEHLRARSTIVTVDGVDQAAPAPRFSRTSSGPVGAPPQQTTPIGEVGW